jgi:uncharacterized membrane protein HdeD (DUF308 family)
MVKWLECVVGVFLWWCAALLVVGLIIGWICLLNNHPILFCIATVIGISVIGGTCVWAESYD